MSMNTPSRTALIAALGALLAAGSAAWLGGCGSSSAAPGGADKDKGKSKASGKEKPAETIAAVRRGRFELRVSEVGEFRPLNCRVMISKAGDKIDWLIAEGTAVKKGELLFTQDRTNQNDWLARDTKELEAARKNLQEVERQAAMERESIEIDLKVRASQVKLAETNKAEVAAGATKEAINEAKAALESARLAAADARAAAEADAKMVKSGYLSAAEAKASGLAADLADIAHERAKLSLALLEAGSTQYAREYARLALERSKEDEAITVADARSRHADIDWRVADAKANVANYERSVARAQREIALREIRADADGVVIYRMLGNRSQEKPEVGSRVWPGNGILDVADLSSMKIRTQLAERHIRLLAPGAAVKVTPDTLQGVQFDGKVTWIDRWSRDRSSDLAKADREREGLSGVKVFALEAALSGSDQRIRPGFRGKVEFRLLELPDALIVPRAALYGSESEQYVMIAQGDTARRVDVEVLAEDEREAAVRGELSEGQALVVRGGGGQ